MRKILFIIPPNISYETFTSPGIMEHSNKKNFTNYVFPVTDMPIGVISLSSYIKKYAKVETRILDFNIILNKVNEFKYESFNSLYKEFLLKIVEEKFIPDIVGISTLFSTSYYNMLDIAKISKQCFTDALIIAGGGIPTNLYKKIFEDSVYFDALCFGEGEKPLLELLKAKDKKKYFIKSPNWITKEKSIKEETFKYDFITNLDEIPFYDYEILDSYELKPTMQNYFNYNLEGHIFSYMTSRGCPYHCSFCASHTVHGRKMRFHSIERIKDDFLILKNKFNVKIINFLDDHLIYNSERMEKIIENANNIGLQLYFQNGIALASLTFNMLTTLKKTGVTDLVLPVESGSSKVLKKIMHKPASLKMATQVVNDCRKLNIDTNINILIGLPGETQQDIEDTRIFLRTLNANWFKIMVATPLVGSEIHNICVKEQYIKKDNVIGDYKNAVINTEDFSSEYIQEKAYLLNLELNFVENNDFKLAEYEKALNRFNRVLKVKEDHAFAYYFSAECYWKLGVYDKYNEYMTKYSDILSKSEFWKNYAIKFGLPI